MRRSSPTEVIKFLSVLGALTYLLGRGTETLGYHWQWYRVPSYLFSFEGGALKAGILLEGLAVTLQITGISLVFTLVLGLIAALFRLSHAFMARVLSRGYVELIRNTPLIVQLFFVYFVLSPVLDMGRFASAVLALSLFEGAYVSEIIRAGILSVQRGQWEAAYGLGLSHVATYRYVILPQAIRHMLPPLASQAISLIKDSALVSTIAIYDLTMRAQAIIAETYLTFELWFTVAAIYLVMTLTLSMTVRIMEKHFSIGN